MLCSLYCALRFKQNKTKTKQCILEVVPYQYLKNSIFIINLHLLHERINTKTIELVPFEWAFRLLRCSYLVNNAEINNLVHVQVFLWDKFLKVKLLFKGNVICNSLSSCQLPSIDSEPIYAPLVTCNPNDSVDRISYW